MKKYKITDIIEDEFGCEGRPEGEEPMVTILLVDDTGKQRSIRMADKLAYEKKLDVGAEMELPEEELMTLNGKEYKVKKLLGKGKGGYSYLVTDGEKEYVLKQIHHEPCSYYQFDNKLEAEKRDYKRLMEIGITMPKLLDIDETQERILKEYIPGDTVYQQVEKECAQSYMLHIQILIISLQILSCGRMSSIMWIMSAMPIWKNGILKTGESSTGLRQKNS